MENIPALVITFNPSYNLENRLDFLYTHFDHILLVDNGSEPDIRRVIEGQIQQRGTKLGTILNPRNLGVATALNQGFSLAMQLGYDYVITLDQDSLPVPGMKEELLQAMQTHPNREKLVVIAPDVIEDTLGEQTRYLSSRHRLSFERVTCKEGLIRNVLFVITSGSMYNLNLYKQIGPFRDDFFIDAIDQEYCLRAIGKGHEVSVACNARLEHHLGNRRQKQFLGKTHSPTFHPPFRWYYISRNRIMMILLYGWRFPQWLFHETGVALKSLIRMLLFENQRTIKVKAILLGTWDGLTRRSGEMPLQVKKSLAVKP